MSEPTTEAGRALLHRLTVLDGIGAESEEARAILAIEAQAAAEAAPLDADGRREARSQQLLEVADLALTEFIAEKGSDFDRAGYPAHAALRSLLTTEAILGVLE